MLVEKIYILGALLKLPFFTHDEEMKNWANSYLTFHSWSPLVLLTLTTMVEKIRAASSKEAAQTGGTFQ